MVATTGFAANRLWAIVGFVVVPSAIVYGITANYFMTVIERHQSGRTDCTCRQGKNRRRTAKPDSSVTRSVEPHRRMLVPFCKVFYLAKQTGRKGVCGCRGQWVRKTAIPKSNPGLQSVGPQHSDQPQDSQVLHPSE